MTQLWRRLRFLPKDKKELLDKLLENARTGNWTALALAYLINELCPDDRTTKHVFRVLKERVRKA